MVGAVSGTLGGNNFALTRSGPVARRPLGRVNKNTTAQLERRNRFAQIVRHWRELTPRQLRAWANSASLVSRTNRLGISRPYNALELYLSYNLAHIGQATFEDLPPRTLISTPLVRDVELVAVEGVSMSADFEVPKTAVNTTVYVFAARAVSTRTINFSNNWKFLRTDSVAQRGQSVDIKATFEAVFGDFVSDEYINVRITSHLPNFLFSASASGGGVVV